MSGRGVSKWASFRCHIISNQKTLICLHYHYWLLSHYHHIIIAQMNSMENCPICLDSYKSYELIELHAPRNIPHKVCRECGERLEKKQKRPVLTVRKKGALLEPGVVSCPVCRKFVVLCEFGIPLKYQWDEILTRNNYYSAPITN